MKITNHKRLVPHLKAEDSKIAKGNRPLSAGFTLIEIIVTIFVFSVIMTIVSAIFVQAVAIERRTVWAQRVQENATLVIESMAKEIRVSGVVDQDSPNCTATTLTMSHPTACGGSPCNVTYSLPLGGTNIRRSAVLPTLPSPTDYLTSFVSSIDVQFTRLYFCITGSRADDNQSPKVTILASLKSSKGSPPVSVNLQTTVTSREITSELQN